MDEIDLYFKAFNGTNEICKIVSNYANKIVDELKKTEKEVGKMDGENTLWTLRHRVEIIDPWHTKR